MIQKRMDSGMDLMMDLQMAKHSDLMMAIRKQMDSGLVRLMG